MSCAGVTVDVLPSVARALYDDPPAVDELWLATYAGTAPPAAVYFYSPDRSAQHPAQHLVSFTGFLQADAYAGFNRLHETSRKPGPIIEAACWAHVRRKFFDVHAANGSKIAREALTRAAHKLPMKCRIVKREAGEV